MMKSPKLLDIKGIVAIKGFEINPVALSNQGGVPLRVLIEPALPFGLSLSIEESVCVLRGIPANVSAQTVYTITASNEAGENTSTLELSVVEAQTKTQREAIIQEHDLRQDLDTPRSQIENAVNDAAMMSSHILPHEKFLNQPTGDDKRLSQQTANNPEAEMNAANKPELTPSPSAKLQAQAVLAAKPPSPTPMPGK